MNDQKAFFERLKDIRDGKVAFEPKMATEANSDDFEQKFAEMLTPNLGAPTGAAKGGKKILVPLNIPVYPAGSKLKKVSPKPTTSELVSSAPETIVPKIKNSNTESSIFMPPAPIEQWKVQVYPDVNQVLHFQAKTSPLQSIYYKWYVKAEAEVYSAVKQAYDSGAEFRKSFYLDSGKQYLVCSRVSLTEVNIPGYGILAVPELFNA